MDQSKLLLLGSRPALYEPLVRQLHSIPVSICVIGCAAETVRVLDEADIALMVLSGNYESCQPFLALFTTMQRQRALPPLLIVAHGSSECFAIASLRAGAREYLTEPVEFAGFLGCISRWIPECATAAGAAELTGGEALVGQSELMQALRAQIRCIAATDCNVLITGETGTGKELVAQLIHQNSARCKFPLVSLNCAAIPDNLLESELFGYERGAFTGAGRANQGKLMAANHGSVFFDEVGDMSPLAQAKVLRAIETKEVQRLGATRAFGTDIRIIAATHRNLDDLTVPESFRRDLYFRLNVGRICLPPLRDRKADLAVLVDRMVGELNRKFSRRIEGVNCAALRVLMQHDWPGNVRELKNVIERAFITRESGTIGQGDVVSILPKLTPPACPAQPDPGDDLRCLREALATCNGNKSRAAEKLNWSRMTLYRKLAKYGLAEHEFTGAAESGSRKGAA